MGDYVGKCFGGPLDGKMLAHWRKTIVMVRRVPGGPIVTGEYRLNDFEQWHWWPTEEGDAANVLFGEVNTA